MIVRRASLAGALALGLVVEAAAQTPPPEAFQLLPAPDPGARITPYLQWQVDRAWEQDDRRRAAFTAVRTEADLLALRAGIRARLLDLLGGLPTERTPLNARVVGTIPMRGYRIEKLIFESLPGVHVTALVYVPDAPAGRKPAVLVACGHAPDGKSFKNYQELAGQLALRGYVVISWDPVGQGERSQFWDAARGRSRYNLVCGEHAVLGNLACLAGTSLNRYEIWDGMRALDYLLTRSDVDATRIAVTGTSGGGLQAAYLGALDERIGVVGPSCFVTSMPMRMANRIFEDPDSDPEQDPPGLVSEGIDHPGLLLLVYPRPLIVAAAVRDFVPIEGARRTVRELAALYRAFGKGDRIAIAEGYHTHMFSPENRRAVFAFLDRFSRMPARDALDAIEILDPKALRCTPSGQVRVDLPGRSLPEVIRDDWRVRRPVSPPRLADLYRGAGIGEWPVVPFTVPVAERAIAWEDAGGSTVAGARIDRYRLHHGTLAIPLLHIHRPGAAREATIVDVGLHGKAGAADWPGLVRLLDDGRDVVSFDLRGVGETRMRYRAESIDDPELAALDEPSAYESPLSGVLANHVYNAQLTGRPYFLDMIEDVEIVVRFARERLGARRVQLRARGDAQALAEAASTVLDGVQLRPGGEPAFRWSEAVEKMQEIWPIQYLLPRGADFK
jgi:alpha/beta hydrolase family protein